MSNCLFHTAEISLYTPREVKGEKENCGHQDGASGKGTCCQDPCLSAAPMGGREN